MTAFKAEEKNDNNLDWTILRDGSISRYKRNEFLEEDLQWLQARGYRIISFDCSGWNSDREVLDALRGAWSFPDYHEDLPTPGPYGKTLNALKKYMTDHLAVPDDGGLAIVLRRFDSFFRGYGADHGEERGEAGITLDIFANASRYHMLFGRRLITLVQLDDLNIRLGLIGGLGVPLNRRDTANMRPGR